MKRREMLIALGATAVAVTGLAGIQTVEHGDHGNSQADHCAQACAGCATQCSKHVRHCTSHLADGHKAYSSGLPVCGQGATKSAHAPAHRLDGAQTSHDCRRDGRCVARGTTPARHHRRHGGGDGRRFFPFAGAASGLRAATALCVRGRVLAERAGAVPGFLAGGRFRRQF